MHSPFLWYLRPCFRWLKARAGIKMADAGDVSRPDVETIAFYRKNIRRVEAVTSLLADGRSKKTYAKAWQFRQTRHRRDYPPYDWRPQYFHMFPFAKDEVFIDCGAFVGDTVDVFIKHCPGYGRIVAFEPDAAMFKPLQAKHAGTRDTILLNAGAYDREGEVFFSGSDGEGNITAENNGGATGIRVTTIDGLKLDKVTFIKMDIEGAELNALKGAEKTILRDKPKLAICIYHSNEDMLRIAEHIHQLVPEYRLRVRHHQCFPFDSETVLYAHMPPV